MCSLLNVFVIWKRLLPGSNEVWLAVIFSLTTNMDLGDTKETCKLDY